MIQRLLPILASLPCAVTLLDLDTGPVYQNGPSLRSVPRKALSKGHTLGNCCPVQPCWFPTL